MTTDPRDAEIRALQQQLQAKTEECELLDRKVEAQGASWLDLWNRFQLAKAEAARLRSDLARLSETLRQAGEARG